MQAVEAWCEGRLAEARAAALESNALATFPTMIALAARCALWSQDLDAAREDLARYDEAGAHGPAPGAYRQVMAAGVAALSGDVDDALRDYRESRTALRLLGLRWDEALAALDMIEVLPEHPEARAAAEAARALMVALGAAPFLERVDAALPGRRGRPAPPDVACPGASLVR